jgi:hypothetical protein
MADVDKLKWIDGSTNTSLSTLRYTFNGGAQCMRKDQNKVISFLITQIVLITKYIGKILVEKINHMNMQSLMLSNRSNFFAQQAAKIPLCYWRKIIGK